MKKCCKWYLDFEDYPTETQKSDDGGSVDDGVEEIKDSEGSSQKTEVQKPNILKALLFHMLDNLALEFMGYYS